MNRWQMFVLGLGLSLSLASAPAAAEDAHSQAAEALFRQAKALMSKGEFAEACEKFSASHELEPGVGTLLYLGDCYERAGRFASALDTFRQARVLAQARGDRERDHLASVRSAALEPRVPKLEIRVGAEQPADLQITINGSPIDRREFNRPLPRDSGGYEVRFSVPGYEPYTSRIELRNGQARAAVVNAPRLVAIVVSTFPAPEQTAPAETGGTQRVVAWVLGGAGVALGIGAGVLAALAAGKNNDSKADCDPADPNRCNPRGVSARQDAQSLATAATVTGLLGGLSLAGGVVLYVSAPSTSESGVPNAALVSFSVPLL
ncbi:MAG TPA: tetratricopeptide repeat protein [Polyangiaceae bacterium]|nr:tetratricopeptide repeat protein [Polyangiaceae bacterium]